jgi:hypothetical protein
VAFRAGKKLEWDAESLKAINAPEIERLIHREYREGWKLVQKTPNSQPKAVRISGLTVNVRSVQCRDFKQGEHGCHEAGSPSQVNAVSGYRW